MKLARIVIAVVELFCAVALRTAAVLGSVLQRTHRPQTGMKLVTGKAAVAGGAQQPSPCFGVMHMCSSHMLVEWGMPAALRQQQLNLQLACLA